MFEVEKGGNKIMEGGGTKTSRVCSDPYYKRKKKRNKKSPNPYKEIHICLYK